MPERAFYEPGALERTATAVREIEALTSAEVVVTLRRASGHYRHSDYLFGFLLSLATLLLLLFSPWPFSLYTFPLDVTLAFLLGTFISARSHGLRRMLTSRRRLQDNVCTAAKAAFVDLGVSRTSGRNGMLVYLSMLERRVELIQDIGIDVEALQPEWGSVCQEMQASLAGRPDLERFLTALRRLGPLLGRTMPRLEGDVNELGDEVRP